jgi:isopentenyl diphosphate isomerase/L-lactate dehydrogenase-like FMN-dependent dehydrogenase
MLHDDELTISLLTRAHKSGFSACILTLDTWQLAWRHHDEAESNYAFYHGIGADLGLSDPVFQKRMKEKGIDPKKQPNEAGAMWIDNVWHGRAWSWEKMPWLMEQWRKMRGGKPFCLKGIQSVADARKAVELGVDGIVVSNHAGRQVDGAVASLDALEKIADGELCLEATLGAEINAMQLSGTRSTLCSTPVFVGLLMSSRRWHSARSLSL